MALPSLPPAFYLVGLDREIGAFERAVRAAPRGIDDGTVYWTDRTDRLDLAVVLEPEFESARTLEAIYVLAVATGEALAPHLPPVVPVAYAWPGDILLDGARAGRVRAALAPVADFTIVPTWLVLGLTIGVASLGHDSGRVPNQTTMDDQGAEVSAVELVEGVARQLLLWTGRWLDEGLAPVRAAWNGRCFRLGRSAELSIGELRAEGVVGGLDEEGALAVGNLRLRLQDAMELLG
jgi:biotin-(acetyl-CoA carboxylase) ligase